MNLLGRHDYHDCLLDCCSLSLTRLGDPQFRLMWWRVVKWRLARKIIKLLTRRLLWMTDSSAISRGRELLGMSTDWIMWWLRAIGCIEFKWNPRVNQICVELLMMMRREKSSFFSSSRVKYLDLDDASKFCRSVLSFVIFLRADNDDYQYHTIDHN